MSDNNEWSSVFPDEPGWYWFFGVRKIHGIKSETPILNIIRVTIMGDIFIGILGGVYITPMGCDGYFMKATPPSTLGLFS